MVLSFSRIPVLSAPGRHPSNQHTADGKRIKISGVGRRAPPTTVCGMPTFCCNPCGKVSTAKPRSGSLKVWPSSLLLAFYKLVPSLSLSSLSLVSSWQVCAVQFQVLPPLFCRGWPAALRPARLAMLSSLFISESAQPDCQRSHIFVEVTATEAPGAPLFPGNIQPDLVPAKRLVINVGSPVLMV